MGKKIDLTYALPSSRLCIDSKVSVSEDRVLGESARVPESTVILEVGAGSRNQTLSLNAGWFFNTSTSLETTDDGRLKSTQIDLGGEAGKVVLGVIGAAGALAGAFIAPPVAASRLTTLSASAATAQGLLEAEEKKETPREREEAAFEAERPEVSAMRQRYVALVEKTVAAVATLSEELLRDPTAPVKREKLKQLERLEALLASFQGELDRHNDLFKAWRSSTKHTRVEAQQRYIAVDSLRGLVIEDGKEPNLEQASDAVKFAWKELGVAATIAPAGRPQTPAAATRQNEVLVRMPRLALIGVYENTDGKAVLRERKQQLVMDDSCETRTLKLRKSLWAKRSVKIGFSDLGTVVSFSHNAESAAAAIAGTAAEAPGKVADSLETAAKARKQIGALHSAGAEEELSRVKQEAEKKQQELTLAGLTATEKDYAELQLLKQKAEILEQRTKGTPPATPPADPAAATIGGLKQQLELLKLRAEIAELQKKSAAP